jgi:alcohol dehydrogenase YqhD (iron-dependent ADH family)
MKPFEFYNPVRIVFGPGEMSQLGDLAAKHGARALLVKGKGPLEKLGVYKRAQEYLEKAGLIVVSLEGVEENPKLSSVYEGIKLCRENDLDIVIAVGGGSPIDCAKAVAMGAVDDGDVWDFFAQKRTPENSLPVGTVSTLAATGSEMSVHCVITNEKSQHKYATHSELHLPKFSIIDAELHTTVPKYITACGMVDTITHVGENYFAGDRNTPLTDRIAEGVITTVIGSESILDNLENIDLRNNLAWCATIGINGLTDLGRGAFEYGAHIIEHAISGKFDIPHGAGLAVVHPAWLYYCCEKDPSKFVTFAHRVFGICDADKSDSELGKAGIDALKQKYRDWEMPDSLKALNIDENSFEDIAEIVIADPDSFIADKQIVLDVLQRCK